MQKAQHPLGHQASLPNTVEHNQTARPSDRKMIEDAMRHCHFFAPTPQLQTCAVWDFIDLAKESKLMTLADFLKCLRLDSSKEDKSGAQEHWGPDIIEQDEGGNNYLRTFGDPVPNQNPARDEILEIARESYGWVQPGGGGFLERGLAIRTTPISWIIKDVIPTGLSQIFGQANTGKSFAAIDIGLAIARGADWHGHKVAMPGAVIYIGGEGASGTGRRIKTNAIKNGFENVNVPFYVSANSVSMLNPDDVDGLIKVIRQTVKEFRTGMRDQSENPFPDWHDAPISMIILDTQARHFGDGDENSTKDMQRFVLATERLMEETGAAGVLLLHHTGLGDKKRARGAYAMHAALDCAIRLDRSTTDGEPSYTMIGTKMRDADKTAKLSFQLETVYMGEDEDRNPITSLVPVSIATAITERPPANKLNGENQKLVYRQALKFAKSLEDDADDKSMAQFDDGQLLTFIRDDGITIRKDHFDKALKKVVEYGHIKQDQHGRLSMSE